jgi:hypothetical protein
MDKISFWKLLSDFDVIIPIIQRDYAQGREGKEYIREKFLEQIKHALKKDDQKRGELDFVYGTMIQQRFYPLDGQQRLTTLWLLHWFVASKAKMLNDDTKKVLKKFSYETRTSSREFCEKLCDYCGDVADIQSQTWFYATWKQDPTIQSMLRMLETMKTHFKEDYVDDYKDLWGKLVGTNCPLKFSKLEITSEELPVSDDLYIKMNARGKPLTDFENLKADLISRLDDKCKVKYGSLIDNAWTNHFWNKDEIGLFDTKWMAFLCRIAVCLKFEKEVNLKKTNDEIAAQLKKWNIYTKDVEGFSYVYTGFLDFNDVIDLERLEKVFKGWEKLIKINGFSLASSWGETFDFIPSRKEGANALSPLTMKGKVLFYGTIRFCEEICKECNAFANLNLKEKWDEWKRIMWNLAENTNESSTLDGFVGVMKLIHNLSEGCLNIYDKLSSYQGKEGGAQLEEEIIKAKRITNAQPNDSLPNEKEIINAERKLFFKGAIRFLYKNEDGEADWSQFQSKLVNVEHFFDKDGVKKHPEVNKIVISYCDNWKDQLCRKHLFGKSVSTWRGLLLNKDFQKPIHHLLIDDKLNGEDEINKIQDKTVQTIISLITQNKDDVWCEMNQNALEEYQLERQWGAPCLWLKRYPYFTIRLIEPNEKNINKLKEATENNNFPKYFRNDGNYEFTLNGEDYYWKPWAQTIVKKDSPNLNSWELETFVDNL